MRTCARRPGHSLIELAVVLTLVALISGLCVPAFLFSRRAVVSAQAHSLQSAFWYAQQLAVATGSPVRVLCDVGDSAYHINNLSWRLAKGVVFGVLPGAYGPPGAPTQQLRDPINTPDRRSFLFWPQGAAQAGSVYLVDRAAGTMYAVTIGVSSLCQVRVYQFLGGSNWIVA